MKKLAEMTLEELWQLFPIILVKHNQKWEDWFAEEKNYLEHLLAQYKIKQISHIGSTAIKNIQAKPTIDILIEIEEDENMPKISKILEENGYICMNIESDRRRSLNKGYTPQGFAEKIFHIHLRFAGDNDEVYFRDYLNKHADLAKEYEKLKLGLWKKYEHDRDAYTNAKSEFVEKYTKIAKRS